MKKYLIGILTIGFSFACSQKSEQRASFATTPFYSLQGGTVTVYEWSEGKKGKVIREEPGSGGGGSFDSPDGEFSGPFLLEITGATFNDPLSGLEIRFQEGDQWSVLVPKNNEPEVNFQVNPYTTFARAYAESLVQNKGTDANAAILRANQALADHLGGVDLLKTVPRDPRQPVGAVDKEPLYGLALLGLAYVTKNMSEGTGVSESTFSLRELVRGVVSDLQDGGLNGRAGAEVISISGVTFDPFVLSTRMADAVRGFLDNPDENRSGLGTRDLSAFLDSLSRTNGELFQAGDGVDRLAPFVRIVSPANGDAVGGVVEFDVEAQDPDGFVDMIEVFYGSAAVLDEDPKPEHFIGHLDSTLLGDGSKRVKVVARDVAGHEAESEVLVVADNGLPEITLAIDGKIAGQNDVVGGLLDISAEVSDGVAGRLVTVTSDDPAVAARLLDSNSDPLRFRGLLQTNDFFPGATGEIEIVVSGEDVAGNVRTESFRFRVNNTGPTITVLEPRKNLNVSGPFSIQVNAASELGVASTTARVFLSNGSIVGLTDSDASADLFRASIDSASYPDQLVTLQVDAVDGKGNPSSQSLTFGFNNVLFDSVHSLNRPDIPWQDVMGRRFGLFDADGDGWDEIWFDNNFFGYNIKKTFTGYKPWDKAGFYPASGQWYETFAPDPDFRNQAWMGGSQTTTCDVNGDGLGDGVWGAHMYPAYPYPGRIWVGFGPQSSNGKWPSTRTIESPDQTSVYYFFGNDVQCLDFNGDGYDDVTSRGMIYFGPQLSTSIDLRPFVWFTSSGNWPGSLWKSLGDIDGDAKGDFLVFIKGPVPTFRVLYGPVGAGLPLQWGAVHSPNINLLAEAGVSKLGDVNGDGLNDYGFVGSTSSSDPEYGTFHVVYGTAARPVNPSVTKVRNGDSKVRYLSPQVSGDFNGDGYSDIAIVAADTNRPVNDDDVVVILFGPGLAKEKRLYEPVPENHSWGGWLVAGDLLHKGRAALLVSNYHCSFGWPCVGDVYVHQDQVP